MWTAILRTDRVYISLKDNTNSNDILALQQSRNISSRLKIEKHTLYTKHNIGYHKDYLADERLRITNILFGTIELLQFPHDPRTDILLSRKCFLSCVINFNPVLCIV